MRTDTFRSFSHNLHTYFNAWMHLRVKLFKWLFKKQIVHDYGLSLWCLLMWPFYSNQSPSLHDTSPNFNESLHKQQRNSNKTSRRLMRVCSVIYARVLAERNEAKFLMNKCSRITENTSTRRHLLPPNIFRQSSRSRYFRACRKMDLQTFFNKWKFSSQETYKATHFSVGAWYWFKDVPMKAVWSQNSQIWK